MLVQACSLKHLLGLGAWLQHLLLMAADAAAAGDARQAAMGLEVFAVCLKQLPDMQVCSLPAFSFPEGSISIGSPIRSSQRLMKTEGIYHTHHACCRPAKLLQHGRRSMVITAVLLLMGEPGLPMFGQAL